MSADNRITTEKEFVMLAHALTLVLIKEHKVSPDDRRLADLNRFIHEGAQVQLEAQDIRGVDPIDMNTMTDWSIIAFQFHFPECSTIRIMTEAMRKEDEL